MANIPRVTIKVDKDVVVKTTPRLGNTSKTVLLTVNKDTAVVREDFAVTPAPPPAPAPAPTPAPAPVLAIPSEVQGKSAAVSGTTATITWTASPAAQQVDYYAVYLKHNGTDLGDGGRPSITGTSVAIPNLAPGAYEFAVAAHNAVGMGPGWPPGLTWMPFTIAGAAPAPAPAPGPAPSAPTIVRAEVAVTNVASGDRGNGWGAHQPRYTVHNDGTERMVCVYGPYLGPDRSWKLWKRAPGGGWAVEAQGQTTTEIMLLRDPTTDLPHLISYPGFGNVPHVHSPPSFQGIAIPGTWSSHDSIYNGAGVGADGSIVVQTYHDISVGTYSKDCDLLWSIGKWNGSRVVFGPVQRKYIGLRNEYFYVLPGAYGNASEIVVNTLVACLKEHVGMSSASGTYVWDGVNTIRAIDAASLVLIPIMPRRSKPGSAQAAYMGIQDHYADSKGRVFSLVWVSDPNGPSGMYLTVRNTSGQVHQGILSGMAGGNPRLHEDTKGRLWVLEFANPCRIYRLNDNFTLGSAVALNFAQQYDTQGGIGRVACPRGGNARSNTITGSFVMSGGASMCSYQIRLPD